MKASDLFVKALENEGVEYIFALPGEENLDILESIRKSSKIKLVLTRHEQGAGFMAATYGRLTGKAGVCMSTLGPGATNMVTPAAYAKLGAMPMVIITGQKPITKSKQGKFQIIDVVEMMRPITKYTKQVTHGHNIPSIIREAFRIAQEERPGSAHIELPEDVATEEVNDATIFDIPQERIPQADEEAIAEAVKIISEAKYPLLLLGADANRKKCAEKLTEFVDKTGIPFINTQMGKGLIDERNPMYVGTAALSADDFLHESILISDLIINVGHHVTEKPPFFMHASDNRKVIHINFFTSGVDEIYFPTLNVVGDISHTIDQLIKCLSNKKNNWNTGHFLEVKKKVLERLTKYERDNRFPILPQRAVKILRDILPDDGIITLDNGVYKIWFARNFPLYRKNGLLLDNALATMGAGLPSAIMAKMLYPDKKVISVNGDGGFMMNSQELETAIRLGIDLTVIILNDSAYGMIKWKQQHMNFPNFGLEYANPDFVKYAESFQAKGYRISSTEELESVLKQTLHAKGVHIIDVPVDYSLNHSILNQINKEYIDSLILK